MRKEDIIKMQISRVEKEIRDTPYDKSSEHHHAVLKTKLAKLQESLDGPSNKGGGGGVGYAIKHSGDASVVLVGLPSVGKSTLLNKVTNAESKVGNYDFTTLGVVPGMMDYKGVKIQILDLPGIVEGASGNKGFGKKVLSVIRAADLVVLMADVKRWEWLNKVKEELNKSGIRLNQEPPKIQINRMAKGGIQVIDPFSSFGKETVAGIAKEIGLGNATVQLNEKIESLDRLVDGMVRTRKYMPMLEVVTKVDLAKNKELARLSSDVVQISAENGVGIREFKERLWQKLGLVRVYLKKERNGEADRVEPLIMKRGQNLEDALRRISNQMRDDVNKACIWGEKARFPGQEVSFSFPLFDEMEVWFGR